MSNTQRYIGLLTGANRTACQCKQGILGAPSLPFLSRWSALRMICGLQGIGGMTASQAFLAFRAPMAPSAQCVPCESRGFLLLRQATGGPSVYSRHALSWASCLNANGVTTSACRAGLHCLTRNLGTGLLPPTTDLSSSRIHQGSRQSLSLLRCFDPVTSADVTAGRSLLAGADTQGRSAPNANRTSFTSRVRANTVAKILGIRTRLPSLASLRSSQFG